jgi:prepilin-type processing-associated H-X9-DG protein
MVLVPNDAHNSVPSASMASNNADPGLDAVYRCPSNNVEANLGNHGDTSHGFYRYSYTMNCCWSMPVYAYTNPLTAKKFSPPGTRSDCVFNGKLSSIKFPAQKILFICEDEQTISSGQYVPNSSGFYNNGNYNGNVDQLASRHTLHHTTSVNFYLSPTGKNVDSTGNVAFCDGHAESNFDRKDSMRQKYSGNPIPDPAGF